MSTWVVLKILKNCQTKQSLLTNRNIGDKDYEHVLKVLNTFEMETIKDYHGLYLKCTVLLLADEFGKFRNSTLKNYVSCQHHLRAPAVSWDTLLSMIKVELELIYFRGWHVFALWKRYER